MKTFPKNHPVFYIRKEDIILREGFNILGKMTMADTDKLLYCVEDAWTISQYENEQDAYNHFVDNCILDKRISGVRK